MLICLAVASLLSFVLFPAKRVTVTADGGTFEVVSRQGDIVSLLGLAGLQQEMGDVLIRNGSALRIERAVPVVVEVDGQALTWRTRATDIGALLSELSIAVGPYDTIVFKGAEVRAQESLTAVPAAASLPRGSVGALAQGGAVLTIQRAVPLTIVEDGKVINFQSARPTLAMALRDAGIRLGPADEVHPSPSVEVTAGMAVEVRHAKAISLRTGASTRVIYTHTDSLKEALAEAGFDLGSDDRVEPAVEAAVTNGMTARLVRVGGRTLTERQVVARKTVFKPDESLTGSASRLKQGSDGLSIREYRLVIEDGVEKEKTLINEVIETETVDNVIYYATANVTTLGRPAENFNVLSKKRVFATWYNAASSGKPATHPDYGITYSGVPLTHGIVAVDPRVIPLGSRLYVPGYGFAVAGDTGGGIIGDMIDLGYPDGVEVDWDTGWAEVYLLAP